jgi:surface polysaccharide O-acyltransferase-like enzyme
MDYLIPVFFLLLFVTCTGAFLLYRRKSIGATVPFARTIFPLISFFAIGVYLLIDPEFSFGSGVVRRLLMMLLALSFLGLSLSFRRNNRKHGGYSL